ncbi:MAG TPA: helix-turn-helix transcriptional regulator [Stellaceae bacterium]
MAFLRFVLLSSPFRAIAPASSALDMQPNGCVLSGMSMDAVFKALADPTRRRLLDRLRARNGQSLNDLCARADMTRQAVTKHLAILEEANLVATARSGREKLHYLNPVPINEIAERWIGKYERPRLRALAELKKNLEADHE